jgi:hypothetical protein
MATKARKADLTITVEVTRNGLSPYTALDHEWLQEYGVGTILQVHVFSPRNEKLWRKYWMVVGTVAKGIGQNPKVLHKKVVIGLQMFDHVETFAGELMLVPISIADLDKAGFEDFYNRAMELLTSWVVPGMTVEDILNQARMPL